MSSHSSLGGGTCCGWLTSIHSRHGQLVGEAHYLKCQSLDQGKWSLHLKVCHLLCQHPRSHSTFFVLPPSFRTVYHSCDHPSSFPHCHCGPLVFIFKFACATPRPYTPKPSPSLVPSPPVKPGLPCPPFKPSDKYSSVWGGTPTFQCGETSFSLCRHLDSKHVIKFWLDLSVW